MSPPPTSLLLFKYAIVIVFPCSEYTITMYDTKSRELRWNATYSDYASTLPDDDTKYSETPETDALAFNPRRPSRSPPLCFQ